MVMTILTHRIKLKPNKYQEEYFRKACGVSRTMWNRGLAYWNEQYEAGVRGITGRKVRNYFNSIRKVQFPWSYEVTKWATQKPLEDLDVAFRRFFNNVAGRPKFKKKGRCRDSFHVGFDNLKISGKRLNIPRCGKVKMCEELRFSGKPKYVTIARSGTNWYASIVVELDDKNTYVHKCTTDRLVGIDIGLKEFAVFSDGTRIERINFTKKNARKLAKAQRSVNRKVKDSKNREKAKAKVSNIHAYTANCRKHFLHNETAKIVRNYRVVGVETLNLQSMAKTKLASSVRDASLGEFKRQLVYKAELSGSYILEVHKRFPSTKMCSVCGDNGKKKQMWIREWTCTKCHTVHDRDLNAAVNLEKVAREYWETVNACGETVQSGLVTIQASFAETGIKMTERS